MRNREAAGISLPEPPPRVLAIRRPAKADPSKQDIERKLQADVAAWLKERRAARC